MSNSNVTTLETSAPAPKGGKETKSAPVQELRGVANGAGGGDFSGKKALLSIAPGTEEGGNAAVFVGVQGVGFQIPRGKQWLVPVEVANAVRDAQETRYSRDDNNKVTRMDVPRFSFIAQDLDDEMAAAYQKKQDAAAAAA